MTGNLPGLPCGSVRAFSFLGIEIKFLKSNSKFKIKIKFASMNWKIEIEIKIVCVSSEGGSLVEHCRAIGAKGGAVSSEAKVQAARANARKLASATQSAERSEKKNSQKKIKVRCGACRLYGQAALPR
jgi:hypothetical protein